VSRSLKSVGPKATLVAENVQAVGAERPGAFMACVDVGGLLQERFYAWVARAMKPGIPVLTT
jgi:hypothetical protein